MQIYQTLGQYPVHGKILPMYSVVLKLDDKKTEIICMNFNTSRKYKLNVIVYNCVEKTWTRCKMRNKYTEIMWNYYRQTKKHKRDKNNYTQLMHHDRKHKSGGGGSRIYNGSITDYECTKNPLHDFRRCYN